MSRFIGHKFADQTNWMPLGSPATATNIFVTFSDTIATNCGALDRSRFTVTLVSGLCHV